MTIPLARRHGDAIQAGVLFALRVAVGWHFLYEGLVKLLDPSWTSAGYLVEARWIFAGFFRWIVEHSRILEAVDFMNAWGLLLIGLGLFFGCFTRIAGMSGILLLFLYYIVIPPLPSFTDNLHTEGSYLIVNKNLIEMIALLLLMVLPVHRHLSIDSLIGRYLDLRAGRGGEPGIATEASGVSGVEGVFRNRREVMKAFAALPLFGVFIAGALRRHGWASFEEKRLMEAVGGKPNAITSASVKTVSLSSLGDLKGPVPKGRIGNVNISRIICGGNLISGFAHSRDLMYVSPLLKTYFTDEKVIDTLRICEACGINTAILRNDWDTIRILAKYWKRGGKIQWLAQTYPSTEDPYTNIQIALDNGAVGAFIQGNIADRLIRTGQIDLIEKIVTYVSGKGVISGIAGHDIRVPITAEAAGIQPDFYMKTLHSRDYWSFGDTDPQIEVIDNILDNYWCTDPERTIEFMRGNVRPWIAYKVLAAGAIHPRDGFSYAFSNGADFACVGMFDFQVIDNANIAFDVLKGGLARKRPWMA